jgi:hypothetical protein
MNNVYIQLENGNILDIDESVGFAVSYSLDDIKNFSKKNTSNSKTIILPSTKNNIKQFGMLGINVNETFVYFNPNFRTKAKLIAGSEVMLDGYFQLKNITKNAQTDLQTAYHQYEIVFFENTIDFFTELGEQYLSDLSFSGSNHEYSKQNIEDSWSHTYSDIYTYPLMYKGSDTYVVADFKPSFFNRAVFDKVIYNSSFTVGGGLLNDPIFNREILPFVGEEQPIPDSEFTRRNFRAGMTGDTPVLSTTTYLNGMSGGTQLNPSVNTSLSAYTYLNNDSTGLNFDNDNHFNILTSTYTVDKNGVYDLNGLLNFKVDFESKIEFTGLTSGTTMSRIKITYPNHQYQAGTNVIITGSTGGYDGSYNIASVTPNTIEIAVPFSGTATGTLAVDTYQFGYTNIASNNYNDVTPNAQNNNGGYFTINVQMQKNEVYIQNFTSTSVDFPTGGIGTTNAAFDGANNWTKTVNKQVNLLRPNLPLLSGDVITLKYNIVKTPGSESSINRVRYQDTSNVSSFSLVPLRIKLTSTTGATNNAYISSTSQHSSMVDGDTVYIDNYLPKKIKLKDYVNDIVRRYNVYITQDELDSKKLLFNSRDDFYAQGGTVDWSDKLDYSFPSKVEFLTDLTTKEVVFSYKNDSDDWNKYYTDNTISVDDEKGQTYGQKRISYDNEFNVKGKSTKIETIMSPTPSVQNSVNNRFIVPGIKTFNPKCNIRVLIWNGLKDPLNTSSGAGQYSWYLDWYSGNTAQRTYYLQYPQALMTDDAEYPTNDIKFGEVSEPFSTAQQIEVDNNLYNKYWKNYSEEIASGKLVTSRFFLTPNDIAYIRTKLNYKVFVKDSYYYISKIKDFDPTKKGQTTEVELLKINKGVPFVPYTGTTTVTTLTPYEAFRLVQPNVIDNTNTILSRNVIVGGSNNFVGPNSDGVVIIGNDNMIGENFRGIVIGSGITASEGGIYLENAYINENGTVFNLSGETISNNFCDSGITTSVITSCNNGNMTIGGGIGFGGNEYSNINTGDYSAVMLGGFGNSNSASYGSSLIGGYFNTASGNGSTSIIGGSYNISSGPASSVVGGQGNSATTTFSSVIGGKNNIASGSNSAVIGGENNIASVIRSAVMGGSFNIASANQATVVGGQSNSATTQASIVAGGFNNIVGGAGSASFVGGGGNNISNANNSAIVGGSYNIVNNEDGFIGGGESNTVSANYSAIIGGDNNTTSGSSSAIIGGTNNTTSGARSAVIGGVSNIASGTRSVVIGGQGITGSTDDTVYIPNLNIQTDKGISFGSGPSVALYKSVSATWNMDTNAASPTISHGLSATEWLTVFGITATITVGTSFIRNLGGDDNYVNINSADIQANRKTGGTFDAALFNAAELVVSFWYVPD